MIVTQNNTQLLHIVYLSEFQELIYTGSTKIVLARNTNDRTVILKKTMNIGDNSLNLEILKANRVQFI